jgi:hypothetical protein
MILAIGSCTSDAKLIATCTGLFSGSQSKSPSKMFDEGCETLKANALRHHGAHLGFLVFAMMSVFTILSSNTRQAKASVETLGRPPIHVRQTITANDFNVHSSNGARASLYPVSGGFHRLLTNLILRHPFRLLRALGIGEWLDAMLRRRKQGTVSSTKDFRHIKYHETRYLTRVSPCGTNLR